MKYVHRTAEENVKEYLETFNGVIITGPRRAGKTTLARKVGEEIGAEFVSMDHPLELEYFESRTDLFAKRHPGKYLILDEIQYARNAGRGIKYLIDIEGRKIIATGSSAEPLSKKVTSYLVGRVGIVELFPFSIEEVARAKGLKKAYSEEMRDITVEYIKYGGFPEVVLGDKKEDILKNLLITAIQRDAARIADTNGRDVMRAVLAITAADGNTVEFSGLSRDSGLRYQTVRRIVDALEISYIVHVARPYHKNKRSELRKASKIYFTDTGIKHAVEEKFGDVISGSDVETAVLSELLKIGLKPKYWRTKGGAEVDFVVEVGLRTIPIEVKVNWGEKVPSGLREFIKTYADQTPAAIIVDLCGNTWQREFNGVTVTKVPLWDLAKHVEEILSESSGRAGHSSPVRGG